jgi:hypothetical protein
LQPLPLGKWQWSLSWLCCASLSSLFEFPTLVQPRLATLRY